MINKFKSILEDHKKWLIEEQDGQCTTRITRCITLANEIDADNKQLRADKLRLFSELAEVKRVANDQASQNSELINSLEKLADLIEDSLDSPAYIADQLRQQVSQSNVLIDSD